jgi:ParB family chromosome partitioning protein
MAKITKEIKMPMPANGRGIFADDNEVISNVSIGRISPNPWQPRIEFDLEELTDLSNSIKEHGLIEPIIVRRVGDGFELIAGERRLEAHKILGKESIKAVVRDIDDEKSRLLALIENIDRVNLDPIEIGLFIKKLIDDTGTRAKDVSVILKKSEATISRYVGLTQLHEDAISLAIECKYKNLKALNALTKVAKEKQVEALKYLIENSLTTDTAISYISSLKITSPRQELPSIFDNKYGKMKINGNKINIEIRDDKLTVEQKAVLEKLVELLK